MNLNGGNNSTTNIHISDSEFVGNFAMHGAGVEITFDTPDSVRQPNHLTIQRCNFSGRMHIKTILSLVLLVG